MGCYHIWTAERRGIHALCMLCQGCGPGRYGLNAIFPSALRLPAATAKSRETLVAQITHRSVPSGVHLHIHPCVAYAEQHVQLLRLCTSDRRQHQLGHSEERRQHGFGQNSPSVGGQAAVTILCPEMHINGIHITFIYSSVQRNKHLFGARDQLLN